MEENISRDCIQLNCTAPDWRGAIRVSAQPLVDTGRITEAYVEQMIENVCTLGPYIVIMPKFALAHAAPSESVIESSMSIATFSEPVNFNCDNDPVYVVMCLACVDREAHLGRLGRMAEKLMDGTFVDDMLACEDAEQLYELINS